MKLDFTLDQLDEYLGRCFVQVLVQARHLADPLLHHELPQIEPGPQWVIREHLSEGVLELLEDILELFLS